MTFGGAGGQGLEQQQRRPTSGGIAGNAVGGAIYSAGGDLFLGTALSFPSASRANGRKPGSAATAATAAIPAPVAPKLWTPCTAAVPRPVVNGRNGDGGDANSSGPSLGAAGRALAMASGNLTFQDATFGGTVVGAGNQVIGGVGGVGGNGGTTVDPGMDTLGRSSIDNGGGNSGTGGVGSSVFGGAIALITNIGSTTIAAGNFTALDSTLRTIPSPPAPVESRESRGPSPPPTNPPAPPPPPAFLTYIAALQGNGGAQWTGHGRWRRLLHPVRVLHQQHDHPDVQLVQGEHRHGGQWWGGRFWRRRGAGGGRWPGRLRSGRWHEFQRQYQHDQRQYGDGWSWRNLLRVQWPQGRNGPRPSAVDLALASSTTLGTVTIWIAQWPTIPLHRRRGGIAESPHRRARAATVTMRRWRTKVALGGGRRQRCGRRHLRPGRKPGLTDAPFTGNVAISGAGGEAPRAERPGRPMAAGSPWWDSRVRPHRHHHLQRLADPQRRRHPQTSSSSPRLGSALQMLAKAAGPPAGSRPGSPTRACTGPA